MLLSFLPLSVLLDWNVAANGIVPELKDHFIYYDTSSNAVGVGVVYYKKKVSYKRYNDELSSACKLDSTAHVY